MRIAHILPASVTFPLHTHNGRYEWVLQLAKLQASSGHDVTIYCNNSSRVDNIRTAGISHLSDDKKIDNIETFRLALKGDHDIYHSHFDNLHYEISHETTKPIVYTQHWWPVEKTIELAQTTSSKNVWAVPPTNYMYKVDIQSGIRTKGYIYHGIDLTVFHPSQDKKNGRLLFVSRISPEKNLEIALSTANNTGLGLDIIGKVPLKNQKYWAQLQSMIDGVQIKYLGPKSHDELTRYYTSARALIFASDVNEPFGLVAIESQACGTPIIMKSGGSRGELLVEGKTGFLCDTKDDFITAAKAADKLNTSDCISFAKKFDVKRMVRQYDELYYGLISD